MWPNLDIVLGTNICQTLSLIESFSLNSRFKNLPEAFLGNGSSMNQTYFGTLKFVKGKHEMLKKLKTLGPDMLAQDAVSYTHLTLQTKRIV